MKKGENTTRIAGMDWNLQGKRNRGGGGPKWSWRRTVGVGEHQENVG